MPKDDLQNKETSGGSTWTWSDLATGAAGFVITGLGLFFAAKYGADRDKTTMNGKSHGFFVGGENNTFTNCQSDGNDFGFTTPGKNNTFDGCSSRNTKP